MHSWLVSRVHNLEVMYSCLYEENICAWDKAQHGDFGWCGFVEFVIMYLPGNEHS